MTYGNNHRSVAHLRLVPTRISAIRLIREMVAELDRRGFENGCTSPPGFPAPKKMKQPPWLRIV
jgi:hypothetical protein